MEKLNSDEKIQIMLNLTGDEIIKVCQVSTSMQKICDELRYNSLWKQKILEEFQIQYTGIEGFKKYRELSKLYTMEFYLVTYINFDSPGASWSDIFLTRDQAVDYIAAAFGSEINYFIVKTNFKYNDEMEASGDLYTIEKSELKIVDPNLIKTEKEEYYKKILKIREFFSQYDMDENEYIESLDETLSEIYHLIGQTKVDELSEWETKKIYSIISEFCEAIVIEDEENCDKINGFIYEIL